MKRFPVKKLAQAFTIALASCFTVSASVAAPYVGTAVGVAKIDSDGMRNKASNTTVLLIAGNQFNDYFALEARLGTGLKSDSVTYNGQKMDVDTNKFYGIYGKAMLPLEGPITPYLLVGATRGTTTSKVAGFKEQDTDTDLSYGLGLDWAVTSSASITLEYIDWFDKDDANVRGLNIGAKLRF